MPARVLMQDFTGVPAVVDLAAMRDAMAAHRRRPGADRPARPGRPGHRPLGPGRPLPHAGRVRLQRRARVRAQRRALRSCCAGRRPRSTACASCRPARASSTRSTSSTWPRSSCRATTMDGATVAFPDTLVGTDSHTTMVNGLGVLGYGVGGIEAEAVLLGQPLYQPMPRVVGVRLFGDLPRGSTATDLVLVISQHAAHARRRGLVRRVRRRRPGLAGAGRPGDDLEHVARVRRDGGALPDRRRDARLPAPDRPRRRAGRAGRGATPRRTRCGASRAPGPTSTRRSSSTCRPSSRASPARAGRRTRSACPTCRQNFRERLSADGRPRTRSTVDGNGQSADDRPRLGGHRRHHLLHQHRQPDGDGRRRAAGAQCAGARAVGQADGQDVAWRPGSRAVTEYLDRGRPARAARGARLRRRRLRLHDVHRQQRAARRRRSRRRSRATSWSWPPCCPATATSRAASIRWPAPATSPRRRSSSPSPWPARSISTSRHEPLGTDRDGKPVFLADIWPTPEEIKHDHRRVGIAGHLRAHLRERVRRRRALARRCRCRSAAAATPGTRPRPTSRGRRSSTASPREPAPVSDIVGARGAGRARRLGHHRPHLAGRLDPGLEPGRPVAAGARRGAARVQLVRRAARPSRGDDARHVRQHPAAQRAGRARKVRTRRTSRRGERDVHLRRGDALPARRRAADRHRRPRIRHRAHRATGRPRARRCWASGPCWPRATSASIAPTWSAWACCRCSSCRARTPSRWA